MRQTALVNVRECDSGCRSNYKKTKCSSLESSRCIPWPGGREKAGRYRRHQLISDNVRVEWSSVPKQVPFVISMAALDAEKALPADCNLAMRGVCYCG